jgi:putative ABC transport system permease protein
MLSDWIIRLRTLFRRTTVERELDDEIRFHLDRQVEAYTKAGVEQPEAVRRARLDFGTSDQVKEEYRDVSGVRALEDLLRDVRIGARSLRRRPMSTLAAILTLAIGIGLNAAVFTVVDWVLLRPMPYPSPHELVHVFTAGTTPPTAPARLTYSEFQAISGATSLAASAAFSTATRVVAAHGLEPAHVTVARVAGDLFATLRITPAIGRAFSERDLASGAAIVMLSDALWRNVFAADPNILGRVITIDGQTHTVVGVLPRERGYPRGADMWRPLTVPEREDDDRENVMVARLASGVRTERASAEMATILAAASRGTRTAWVDGLQRSEVRDVRATLTAIFVSAALILLMASANVAGLLSARAADRAGEMALRGALGASRIRLVRQLLTEHVLLAAAGGAAGLLLGRAALDVLIAMAPAQLPRAAEIALDIRILLAGVGATAAVGLFVGLAPAFQASRCEFRAGLGVVGSAGATSYLKSRNALVAGQTALAVLLTICAALLGRSLQHLMTIDNGFAANRLMAVDLYLRGGVAGDTRVLFREIIDAARSVPGVRSAAVGLRLPSQIAGPRMRVRPAGGVTELPIAVALRPVTPGYFETAAIPLRSGRDFTLDDRRDVSGVGIVNAAFVREAFGRAEPLGATLTTNIVNRPLSIVGVVGDVTPAGEPDLPAMYLPIEQAPIGGGYLLVRTLTEPQPVVAALKERLRATAPALALDRIQIVDDALENGRSVTRFTTRLAFTFAALALLLAATGVYALTAGEVATRWRELAIRLALGATRYEALWTVIRPGATAVAVGIAIGTGAALGVGRWISVLLRGVGAADPPTLIAVPALLGAVGLAAGLLAALRVLREDPAATLHRE